MSTYLNIYLQKNDEEPVLLMDFSGHHPLCRDLIDESSAPYPYVYNPDTQDIETRNIKAELTSDHIQNILDEHYKFIRNTERHIAMYREFMLREDHEKYFELKKLGRECEYPFRCEGDDSDEFSTYIGSLNDSYEVIQELIRDEDYLADLQREVGQLEMLQHLINSVTGKSWTTFTKILVDVT